MNSPVQTLNREALSRLDEAMQREWIVTNGLGGYASSTVLGLNTRKYHGLLVAAFHPPSDRRVCLAKLDEELVVGSSICPLSSNEFQTGIFPKGHLFLKEFSLMPFPRFVYETQGVEVQKTVFMPHGKNVAFALYKVLNRSNSNAAIKVFPLVSCRPFHSVVDRWKADAGITHEEDERKVEICSNSPQSTLILAATNGRYEYGDKWVERLCFREEANRGESSLDDCLQPGFFEVNVSAKRSESFAVTAVADQDQHAARRNMDDLPATLYDMGGLFEKEIERREGFLDRFYGERGSIVASDWLSWFVSSTDTFMVQGSSAPQRSVIAGYYWFEAWGRDTFVSLPGLLLVTGRFEEARQVFLSFKSHCRQGLIPNFIPEVDGEPVYNSVDATLWFVNAVLQYLKYTGDFAFVQQNLWDTLKAIAANLAKGTMFSIHVDADGLLAHSGQLTWMDAAVNGQPVTPRDGKAVEVQALWFNALRTMELLANGFSGVGGAAYAGMAECVRKSFVEKFWNADGGFLFDVVGDGFRDASLRPNQIVAAALDFSMLDGAKSESVVDVVQQELLTPFGLRTLARGDSRYVGVYFGDRGRRDIAYHNGTVWPWLLGPFTTAYLKAKGHMSFRREYAYKNILSPLLTRQISEAGLGYVSEIFDGEPPHTARGCVAQAWSMAEPLRAYLEDVLNVRPQHEREVLGLVR